MRIFESVEEIISSPIFGEARAAGCKLSDDTRELSVGDIFVLRQGASPLGAEVASRLCAEARAAGARAIIGDAELCAGAGLPVLGLANVHEHLGELARGFWGDPSGEMKVVAVTGTNGKTTTTYLIESVARVMGLKVGVLGTISHRYPGYEECAVNTTPGTLKLQRLLRAMADAGCDLVAMEVSSHGIMQGRIDGISFDVAVWNNLGTDHLDFHKTREAYGLAKRRLFDTHLVRSFAAGKLPVAVGNASDDDVMRYLREARPESWGGRMATFALGRRAGSAVDGNSIENANIEDSNIEDSNIEDSNIEKANIERSAVADADVAIDSYVWAGDRWTFKVKTAEGVFDGGLPLAGVYNLLNAAGAVTALVSLGYDVSRVVGALGDVAQIPGRMERVNRRPLVVVDFAHTPEALKNVLMAARECVLAGGRLISVFGAGGDRDASKRPMMGRISQSQADVSIVTSDNPRTEKPEDIIEQIVAGMKPQGGEAGGALHHYIVEVDRAKAIERALEMAKPLDVVVIAGKGHEDYQIVGTEKRHFDDREVVRAFYAETV
ncbi:MAG: UDP-N-acetylmuramoyl-L-alanyl-D-glutamate--2,6-diaminopimelate ligase [Bradymonadales bacterium]|nr:UDP-N-acetylmuramoyl-L-alanyl-D-glutamate--2,6-diaminopimelate ligase [Bradymonadales bacterium]